jgi:hypothetical protein
LLANQPSQHLIQSTELDSRAACEVRGVADMRAT